MSLQFTFFSAGKDPWYELQIDINGKKQMTENRVNINKQVQL